MGSVQTVEKKKLSKSSATKEKPSAIQVKIVSKIDELVTCVAIRGASFIARGEPFAEEFDENDLTCATHLLAYLGKEPIGTMRIRILSSENGGLATWERLAVLPSAGRSGVKALLAIANTAKAYTQFKGVDVVIGAVEDQRLVNFWIRQGCKPLDVPPAIYNNVEYKKLALRLPRLPLPTDGQVALGNAESVNFDKFLTADAVAA